MFTVRTRLEFWDVSSRGSKRTAKGMDLGMFHSLKSEMNSRVESESKNSGLPRCELVVKVRRNGVVTVLKTF